MDDEKAREIEAGRRERRRIRPVRRRDPHDVALLRLHVRERRQRETDFTDTFALEQQLPRERLAWAPHELEEEAELGGGQVEIPAVLARPEALGIDLAAAARTFDARYRIPYISHVPL